MANIHDIPGEQKAFVTVPRGVIFAAGTVEAQEVPVFEAPFACKVTKVTCKSGLDWLSQDASYAASVTLKNAGAGGTIASPLGLGTLGGSVVAVGTPMRANRPATLYAGTVTMAATGVLKVSVANGGTAGTVPPSNLPGYFVVETTFKGD